MPKHSFIFEYDPEDINALYEFSFTPAEAQIEVSCDPDDGIWLSANKHGWEFIAKFAARIFLDSSLERGWHHHFDSQVRVLGVDNNELTFGLETWRNLSKTSDINSSLEVMRGVTIKDFVKTDFNELELKFSNNVAINGSYWRFFSKDGKRFSSYDHNQQYGLPKPYDAYAMLKDQIYFCPIESVTVNPKTKDIELVFTNESELHILNVTGNEVWQIIWEDGNLDLSNYQ